MTPLELTQRMYAHAAAGEWDDVAGFLAEDLVIHEPSTLPYGGKWEGRDALQRLFGEVMGFWHEPQVEMIDLVGGDHHVVALLQMTVTAPGTDKRFTHRITEVSRFALDGKISEMHIHYFDTGEIARHLGS